MRIRKSCVDASRVVRKFAEKYGLNKLYIWEVIEEKFGLIKGTSPVLVQEEIDILEDICRHALDE